MRKSIVIIITIKKFFKITYKTPEILIYFYYIIFILNFQYVITLKNISGHIPKRSLIVDNLLYTRTIFNFYYYNNNYYSVITNIVWYLSIMFTLIFFNIISTLT